MSDETPIDLWAEQRERLAELIERLTPEDAIAGLRMLVRDCPRGELLGAHLSGYIIGMAERRAREEAER